VHVHGVPRHEAERRAAALLEQMGVGARAHALPRELSGGEAQRVAIARALAVDPPLLLMDEPTASLDPARRDELGETLERLTQSGRTLLAATHDDDFVRDYADRVIVMAGGRSSSRGFPPTCWRRRSTRPRDSCSARRNGRMGEEAVHERTSKQSRSSAGRTPVRRGPRDMDVMRALATRPSGCGRWPSACPPRSSPAVRAGQVDGGAAFRAPGQVEVAFSVRVRWPSPPARTSCSLRAGRLARAGAAIPVSRRSAATTAAPVQPAPVSQSHAGRPARTLTHPEQGPMILAWSSRRWLGMSVTT